MKIIKSIIFIFLLFSELCEATPLVKIELISLKILTNRKYVTSEGYIQPSSDEDIFIQADVRIINESKGMQKISLEKLLMVGGGIIRKPAAIILDTYIAEIKGDHVIIGPNKIKMCNLLYAFPDKLKPTKLVLDNTIEILLPDEEPAGVI